MLLREVLRLRFAELLMDRVGLMSELRLDVGVAAAAEAAFNSASVEL